MKVGDFVTAVLVGGNGSRKQGVFVKDNGDGTIQVEGQLEIYNCLAEDVSIIPDNELFGSALYHVQAVRQRLANIKIVTLKNGAEVAELIVASTFTSLTRLKDENPIAFYELVMMCRDPNHKPFGNMGEVLKTYTLIKPDGCIHNEIRDIVLSAVEGEELGMSLGSPVAV